MQTPSQRNSAIKTTPANAAVDLLRWWHLCSLDAPTVTALWLFFAAKMTHGSLPHGLIAAMFLAVWIIYALDRLLDARSPAGMQPRHHFHAQHRTLFVPLLFAAGGLLFLMLAGGLLPHLLLERYLGLGAALLLWLAAVHLVSESHDLPKEIATGAFFSAAIFLPLLGTSAPLALHAGLLASLCTLNCILIRGWESGRYARALGLGTLALAALSLLDRSPFGVAIGLAAVGLLLLHLLRNKLEPTLLRAAADLALLTPLLVLAWLR